MRNFNSPEGVSIVTISPNLCPINPKPTGDSLEILPFIGSASAEPTIEYSTSSSNSKSYNFTVEPTLTMSLFTSSSSITSACEAFFLIPQF